MNKFYFLDIDGTLLDKQYQTNDSKLPLLIGSLQEKGNIFALNSNRSLEDLLPVAKKFSLQGPMVGENGVFIYDQQKKEKTFLLTKKELIEIQKEIEEIKRRMKNFLHTRFLDKFNWEDTDTVKVLSSMPQKYEKGSVIVFNNQFRTFTLSSHIKIYNENGWEEDGNLLNDLVNFLKANTTEESPIVIDYSQTFGNLLVYPKNASKRKAVEYLKEMFLAYTFVAIGDERGDYDMVKGYGKFYTTGNAAEDIKQLAEYASPYLHTKGVSDILRSIE